MKITTKYMKGVAERAGYTDVKHRFTGQRSNKKTFYFDAKKDGESVRVKLNFDIIKEQTLNGSLYERAGFGQWRFIYFLNLKGES